MEIDGWEWFRRWCAWVFVFVSTVNCAREKNIEIIIKIIGKHEIYPSNSTHLQPSTQNKGTTNTKITPQQQNKTNSMHHILQHTHTHRGSRASSVGYLRTSIGVSTGATTLARCHPGRVVMNGPSHLTCHEEVFAVGLCLILEIEDWVACGLSFVSGWCVRD